MRTTFFGCNIYHEGLLHFPPPPVDRTITNSSGFDRSSPFLTGRARPAFYFHLPSRCEISIISTAKWQTQFLPQELAPERLAVPSRLCFKLTLHQQASLAIHRTQVARAVTNLFSNQTRLSSRSLQYSNGWATSNQRDQALHNTSSACSRSFHGSTGTT